MSDEFTVGDYLLSGLAEVGVRRVFGVPGDYNLAFLDHIVDSGEISWAGNAKLPKMGMPEYLLALARAAATANGIGQAA